MRRRVWALILELDTLNSFIFGLPIHVSRRHTDTEPPRNLHDEDLNEDMTALPPSRPDTEMTRMLYQILTYRIISVFANIVDVVTDFAGSSYTRVLQLDLELTESDQRIPAVLRPRPPIQALMDPIGLIIKRYWLQMLVLRARCVLHRRWLKVGRIDRPKINDSKYRAPVSKPRTYGGALKVVSRGVRIRGPM